MSMPGALASISLAVASSVWLASCEERPASRAGGRATAVVISHVSAELRLPSNLDPIYKQSSNGLAVTLLSNSSMYSDFVGDGSFISDAESECTCAVLCDPNDSVVQLPFSQWVELPGVARPAKEWAKFDPSTPQFRLGSNSESIIIGEKTISGIGKGIVSAWLDRSESFIGVVWSKSRSSTPMGIELAHLRWTR
jgi:hypothetical protein